MPQVPASAVGLRVGAHGAPLERTVGAWVPTLPGPSHPERTVGTQMPTLPSPSSHLEHTVGVWVPTLPGPSSPEHTVGVQVPTLPGPATCPDHLDTALCPQPGHNLPIPCLHGHRRPQESLARRPSVRPGAHSACRTSPGLCSRPCRVCRTAPACKPRVALSASTCSNDACAPALEGQGHLSSHAS